jgi:transcription elongation factor GreA
MDSKPGYVYLTKERLHELETELNRLKVGGRKEVAEKIAEARSHGDLSENSEYDAAKIEQEHLEMKIHKYEEMLARVKIISASDMPDDKIYILHNVKLRDLSTKEEFTYKLVSPEESDLDQDKISVASPLGKLLLGKKKNDEIELNVPAGLIKYKILDIFK